MTDKVASAFFGEGALIFIIGPSLFTVMSVLTSSRLFNAVGVFNFLKLRLLFPLLYLLYLLMKLELLGAVVTGVGLLIKLLTLFIRGGFNSFLTFC